MAFGLGSSTAFYDTIFVRPVAWLAPRECPATKSIPRSLDCAVLTMGGNRLLTGTQTGSLRWYASGLPVGSAVFLVHPVVSLE